MGRKTGTGSKILTKNTILVRLLILSTEIKAENK